MKKSLSAERAPRMCDFTWASAARYVHALSTYLGLREIDWGRLYSFDYSRVGPDRLLKRKRRDAGQIERSLELVKGFGEGNRSELTSYELAVLRSLYSQYLGALAMINDHIERLEEMKRREASLGDLFPDDDEGDDNEPLF